MKFTTTILSLPLASLALAAPVIEKRQTADFTVTFQGAPPDVAFFTQVFPGDNSLQTISNPLSISHIVLPSGGANCVFHGIDGSVTNVGPGSVAVDVGPPQTQISGQCFAL